MPTQSIHAIVRERADALIAAFHTDMLPTVIATRDLPGLAWLSGAGSASVERLDAAKDSAMIWRRATPALSSLWIRKSRRDYREAYLRFVEMVHGANDRTGFSLYEIDHLFDNARAFDDATLLRVEAIPLRVNRPPGTAPERHNFHAHWAAAGLRDARKMSFAGVLKLAGHVAPVSPDDTAQIAAVRAAFAAKGWAGDAVDAALATMLGKVVHAAVALDEGGED